jgi:hypothetical protein
MRNERIKMIFLISVFYGSLWGMSEAILGYALHLLPFAVSGFVMFPIGFYLMSKAYNETQNASTVFYTGIVAAIIKLIDLFLPLMPLKTINPAVSILMESLIAATAIKLYFSKSVRLGVVGAIFASIGWRLFFVIYVYVLTFFSIPSGLLESGNTQVLKFILLEGVVNSAIILVCAKAVKANVLQGVLKKVNIRPLIPVCLFVAALTFTLVFAII